MEELLKILKTMVNETDEDILTTYLDIAGQTIINRAYPFLTSDDELPEVPKRYRLLQCNIACYLINKRGAEGQAMHTENGIQRQYESGYIPESLLREIVPFCSTPSKKEDEINDMSLA